MSCQVASNLSHALFDKTIGGGFLLICAGGMAWMEQQGKKSGSEGRPDFIYGRVRALVRRLAPCLLIVAALEGHTAFAADVERDLTLGLGYRNAELNWNIAGNLAGTSPNVLSELKWYDMQMVEVNAAAELRVGTHVLMRGRGAYDKVMDGRNQDSDFSGDNRTGEFSRSNNKGDGQAGEGSAGLGYVIPWYDSSVGRYARIIPQVGYAWRGQYFNVTDGRQTIPQSAAGPIANLNSSYHAEWQGPWLGLSIDMDASEDTRVRLDFEYHLADYHAEANWNLRDDWAHPVSFVHNTRATGVVAALELNHKLSKLWSFVARIESQRFVGEPGTDTINTINSGTGAIEQMSTRLNEVLWQSFVANVGVTLRF